MLKRNQTQAHPRRRAVETHRAPSAKRGALMAVSLALVGALIVGGSFAWLTDKTDDVVNMFDPAEVTCVVDEVFDGETKSNVKVRNTGDVDAYVRATVVANWVDKDGCVHGTLAPSENDYEIAYAAKTGWALGADGYRYYVEAAVAPGEFTGVLISSCALKEGVTAPSGYYLEVCVVADAIQADGVDEVRTPAVVDAWEGVSGIGSDGKLVLKTA